MPEVAVDAWARIREALDGDVRVGPQLQGFMNLVEPKGIMAGVIYLEVPNDFTRSMLEQRARMPLTEAIGGLSGDFEIHTFAVTVNPEIAPDPYGSAASTDGAAHRGRPDRARARSLGRRRRRFPRRRRRRRQGARDQRVAPERPVHLRQLRHGTLEPAWPSPPRGAVAEVPALASTTRSSSTAASASARPTCSAPSAARGIKTRNPGTGNCSTSRQTSRT